jgi:hypothetical protein
MGTNGNFMKRCFHDIKDYECTPGRPPVFQIEPSEMPLKKHSWLKLLIVAEFLLSGYALLSVPHWARVLLNMGLKSDDLPAPTQLLIAIHNALSNDLGNFYMFLGAVVTVVLGAMLWLVLIKAKCSKVSLGIGAFLMLGVLVASSLPIALPFIKVQEISSHSSDMG